MQRIPRRNLGRALFLLVALLAIISIKRSSGGFFGKLWENMSAGPAPAGVIDGGSQFRRLEVKIPQPPDAAPSNTP